MTYSPSHQDSSVPLVPQHNFFLLIPAFIADDPDLDDSTKLFFGRLVALSNNKGYCFATDEYLADLCKCGTRVITDRLKALEFKGYIYRDTKKKGMSWDRKIYPIFENKNIFTKGTHVPHREEQACPIEGHMRAQEQYKGSNNIREQQHKSSVVVSSGFSFEDSEKVREIEKLGKIEEDCKAKAIKYTLDEIKIAVEAVIRYKEKLLQKGERIESLEAIFLKALKDKWIATKTAEDKQHEKEQQQQKQINQIQKNRQKALEIVSSYHSLQQGFRVIVHEFNINLITPQSSHPLSLNDDETLKTLELFVKKYTQK